MIQSICIIFETLLIIFLLLYVRNLNLRLKMLASYINRIICDETIYEGSMLSISLHYGIPENDLRKLLEEKGNEYKKS